MNCKYYNECKKLIPCKECNHEYSADLGEREPERTGNMLLSDINGVTKLKVNKKEFNEHLEYFKKINECKLKDLDLSDFNLENKTEIEKFKFTGLNNKLIIEAYNF